MTDRLLSMLGLCMRAGKMISGEKACIQAVRNGTVHLAVLDRAASANAVKAVTDACTYHNIPLIYTRENELGYAVGKPGRMTAAITDPSFADRIIEIEESVRG